MDVGFTGTREGLTAAQYAALRKTLEHGLSVRDARHGCRVGADAAFHDMVKGVWPSVTRHGYPCDIPAMRAPCDGLDRVKDPKPPLERNRDIVDHCKLLIACTDGMEERIRSGTWSTVRYARKKGRWLKIIFPDGSVKEENPPK